ncbi:MAG TPA: PD40 domain-containing protein [Thermosynechococcus sp. M46_R2017_013]|nr:PD40 domain-containing protein [Thermosynechococcus sp. M46_R2017_013]
MKDPFGQITWSPDGNQFAFSLFTGEFIRDEAGQPVWEVTQIALFHLSDGSLTPLVRGFLPNWSPDRRYIAYLMYPPSMLPLRLQIFDLQTKQVTEVASFMKEDVFPKFAWLSATELAFYKGEPLVFDTRVQQTRPLLTTDLLARANHSFPLEHITTAPANGVLALGSSREILLLKWNNGTAQFIRQIDEGLDHTYWALSPDGSLLAYVSALSRQVKIVGVYDSNIFVELPATGRGSPLVEGWSPDGTALLYLDFESLKIVNRDGSGLRQIAGEFGHVRWAPDGSRIIGVGSNGQLLEIAITRQQ